VIRCKTVSSRRDTGRCTWPIPFVKTRVAHLPYGSIFVSSCEFYNIFSNLSAGYMDILIQPSFFSTCFDCFAAGRLCTNLKLSLGKTLYGYLVWKSDWQLSPMEPCVDGAQAGRSIRIVTHCI
jgi:hypothetical protein